MIVFDVLAELFAEFSLDGFVALGASFVDVDFPADAAGKLEEACGKDRMLSVVLMFFISSS